MPFEKVRQLIRQLFSTIAKFARVRGFTTDLVYRNRAFLCQIASVKHT